ncbi:MAG: hypothetical protein M9949_12660 [Candidatus Kapabacteria bacterium]|nr:hypothetical protein [Candidatus Kapabacteria bacterium]
MEQEQIIYDYIEGVLPPEKELELFQMLTANEELRAELKSQMAIKSAVKSDVVAYTPKAQSTMNIFNTIGLTPPPGIAPIPSPGFFSVVAAKFSSISPLLLTGMATAVATAVVIFMLYNFGTFDGALAAKYGNNQTSNNSSINNINQNAIPTMTSEAEVAKSNVNQASEPLAVDKSVAEPKVVYKYIYVTKDDTKANENQNHELLNNDAANDVSSPSEVALSRANLSSPVVQYRGEEAPLNLLRSPYGTNDIRNPMIETAFIGNEGNENFAIEFRGSIYNHGEGVKIDPAKYDMANVGISGTYSLFDDLKVGVDWHRENFYQTFSGVEDGVLYTYNQNPNIETYGVFFRYHPDFAKIGYFAPFAQVNGAYSTVGPVFRGMIGLEFSTDNTSKFVVAYGYNHLRFKHGGNWFDSGKTGLQIGFGFKF